MLGYSGKKSESLGYWKSIMDWCNWPERLEWMFCLTVQTSVPWCGASWSPTAPNSSFPQCCSNLPVQCFSLFYSEILKFTSSHIAEWKFRPSHLQNPFQPHWKHLKKCFMKLWKKKKRISNDITFSLDSKLYMNAKTSDSTTCGNQLWALYLAQAIHYSHKHKSPAC